MTSTRKWLSGMVLASLLACAAIAQEKKPTPAPKNEPATDASSSNVSLVGLKHADARHVQQMLATVLQGQNVRVTSDSRQNALLISGSAVDIARIAAVIDQLDVKDTNSEERRVAVLQLKDIAADAELGQALNLALEGTNSRFSLDARRRMVVLSGDTAATNRAKDVIARLEQLAARPAPAVPTVQNVQIRLIWLVNLANNDELPSPPEDMKDVLATLAKIGFNKPRLAAQSLVSASPETQFHLKGIAGLGGPCRFSAEGQYNGADTPGLSIKVNVTRDRAGTKMADDLCQIQTEITAPPGHFVVLGMTPTDNLTSALIVQIIKPEGVLAKP